MWRSPQTPDGLWAHFWGPLSGHNNDTGLLTESEFEDKMMEVEVLTGEHYCVYADSIYALSNYVQTGYKPHLGEIPDEHSYEAVYNKTMNASRTAAEWGYGGITQLFPFLDNMLTQKLGQCPIALHYRAAVLLYNCYQCMYGTSVTGSYFHMSTPNLGDYLSGAYFAGPSEFVL